ncbi:MAG: TIGR00645 family protein [Rhodospirillales bacterium]|nr:TIGR00645 family protein [Rhodospirillales bacterium]
MVERFLENVIFRSRWLLAPIYVGLAAMLAILMVKFAQELLHIVPRILDMPEEQVVLASLTLVDIALIGNLLLMVVFAGYENFVSKIDTEDHADRPDWMGKVDMSALKIRLIASIVAISSIQLLKAFLNVDDYSDRHLAWLIGIHAMFVVSGVLLALMDLIAEKASAH